MREKFQLKQRVNVFKKINTVPKATKLYNPNSTFVSPIYTFSLAGNIIVYKPIQGTNKEKYFNHLSITEKCRLWRELNTSPSISSFIHRVFSIFRRKKYGSNPLEKDTKVIFPTPTQ